MLNCILSIIILMSIFIGSSDDIFITWGSTEQEAIIETVVNDTSIIVLGELHGSSDMDPSSSEYILTSQANWLESQYFISKYVKSSNLMWSMIWDIGVTIDQLATDHENNLILSGCLKPPDYIDVDPSESTYIVDTNFNYDSSTFKYILMKLTADGYLIWYKEIDGSIYDIACDSMNNIWTTGNNEENAGSIFIRCFSKSGDLLKSKVLGGTDNPNLGDRGEHIFISPQDNVYITGYIDGKDYLDAAYLISLYDMGYNQNNGSYLLKINQECNLLWINIWSCESLRPDIIDIDFNSQEDIYIAGISPSTIDLNPGHETDIYSCAEPGIAFMIKCNSNGEYLWSETYHTPDYLYPVVPNSIIVDEENSRIQVSFRILAEYRSCNENGIIYVSGLGDYSSAVIITADSDGNYLSDEYIVSDSIIALAPLSNIDSTESILSGAFGNNMFHGNNDQIILGESSGSYDCFIYLMDKNK